MKYCFNKLTSEHNAKKYFRIFLFFGSISLMTQKSRWGKRRTCQFHHWTPGGSVDPSWLRFLTSRTITKLGPGPKNILDARINDTEIPHGVRGTSNL